jgi:fluoride ion exporter CrcB/FEX
MGATFSAFSLQTPELMRAGEMFPALLYAVGSVLATYGGWLLGRV